MLSAARALLFLPPPRSLPPLPARADETPKTGRGPDVYDPGGCTAEFRWHRETTYATVHAMAPFYSVLIRLDPEHPRTPRIRLRPVHRDADADRQRPDLYVQDPRGVKWHDGSPLTSADVAASWEHIVHPPPGYYSARETGITWSTPSRRRIPHRGVQPEVPDADLPAGAGRSIRLCLQEGHPGEGSALVREEHYGQRALQVRRATNWPVDQGRAQSRLLPPGAAVSRRVHRHLCRQAGGAGRGDPRRPRGDRIPRPAARGDRSAEEGTRRQGHRADQRLELRQPDHAELEAQAVRRCAGAQGAAAGDRPVARRAGAVEDRQVQTVGGIVFPARRWPRPRRSCRRWPASGPTSTSRAPRRSGC